MMDEVAYRAWLEANWTFQRFQEFCAQHGHFEAARAYAPEELAALGGTYGKLDPRSVGLRPSFEKYWKTLNLPAFGRSFWSSPIRVGLYFREHPLPMYDAQYDINPPCPRKGCHVHFGQEPLPEDVMQQAVAHLSHGHKLFTTLRRGLGAARELIAGLLGIGTIDVPDSVVVTDVMKRFAPFDAGGRPFKDRLGKQSAHREEMYRFSAPLFVEEITKHLGLRYVFMFGVNKNPRSPLSETLSSAGKAGWHIYQPADGTGKPMPVGSRWSSRPTQSGGRWIVVLPHPQAWHGALAKAVKIALGDGREPLE